MYCSNCGSQNKDNVNYCSKCGCAISTDIEHVDNENEVNNEDKAENNFSIDFKKKEVSFVFALLGLLSGGISILIEAMSLISIHNAQDAHSSAISKGASSALSFNLSGALDAYNTATTSNNIISSAQAWGYLGLIFAIAAIVLGILGIVKIEKNKILFILSVLLGCIGIIIFVMLASST